MTFVMRRILISSILLTVLSAISLFSQPATSYEEAEKWGKSMYAELEKENVAHPMRYVILTNRSSFGKQVLQPNTIYEIQSTIDLQGATVSIPERCILLFNGGSLKNGRIVGDETQYCTKIQSKIFACDTTGTFMQVPYIVKASEIGLVKNNANRAGSNYNILKQFVQRGSNLYLDGKYYVTFSNPIELGRVFCLYGGELVFEKHAFRVTDEDYVRKQLQAFCDNELRLYLAAFKSPSRLRLLQKRFFPQAYKKWLFDYRKRDLMFTLHTLRSEQNRETAIVGLEHLLSEKQIN